MTPECEHRYQHSKTGRVVLVMEHRDVLKIGLADGTSIVCKTVGKYQFIMGGRYCFTLERQVREIEGFDGLLIDVIWVKE